MPAPVKETTEQPHESVFSKRATQKRDAPASTPAPAPAPAPAAAPTDAAAAAAASASETSRVARPSPGAAAAADAPAPVPPPLPAGTPASPAARASAVAPSSPPAAAAAAAAATPAAVSAPAFIASFGSTSFRVGPPLWNTQRKPTGCREHPRVYWGEARAFTRLCTSTEKPVHSRGCAHLRRICRRVVWTTVCTKVEVT